MSTGHALGAGSRLWKCRSSLETVLMHWQALNTGNPMCRDEFEPNDAKDQPLPWPQMVPGARLRVALAEVLLGRDRCFQAIWEAGMNVVSSGIGIACASSMDKFRP